MYRVRNWKEYNKALTNRGDLTFWISDSTLKEWDYTGKRRRGGVQLYSDVAIKASLAIKELFHLPFRMTEGFMKSILNKLSPFPIKAPNYTTLCRRAKEINFRLSAKKHLNEPLHVLIDSTGMSIYGEGEWQRKKLGKDKQRDWRKLHIAVDAKEQIILSLEVSGGRGYDSHYFGELIDKVRSPIEKIYADGAYDKLGCYLKAYERKSKLITPPQRTACEQKENRGYENNVAYNIRDDAIRFIKRYLDRDEGRKAWKEAQGYHKRSLVETTMFRLKSIFGDVVRCRTIETQKIQLLIRCYVLNQMTRLGMPKNMAVK